MCMCMCGWVRCIYVGVRCMFFKPDLNGFCDYSADDPLPVSDVSVL